MKLIDWVQRADLQFRTNLLRYEDTDFDLAGARIFYIDKNDHISSHSIHHDVYDRLNLITKHPIPDCQILGIETCGRAAPLDQDGNPDGAPSEHPARRRVRMITVADLRLNTASMIVFEDDPNNPTFDEDGDGIGSLADGLRRVVMSSAVAIMLRERQR